jgi:hypothetical protein
MMQIITARAARRYSRVTVTSDQGRGSGDSVEREVQAQHRRLDALFEDARDALHGEDALAAATEAFGILQGALETHFAQEDRLYYPAIWALRPEQKPELQAAVDAHQGFRAGLGRIESLLTEGELGAARRAFDELAESFARHEALEERVLARLARETTALR